VDSDLAEAVSDLKAIFAQRHLSATFGQADEAIVRQLEQKLRIPDRYAAFLRGADPIDVETVTPSERVRLASATDLEQEQIGYGSGDDQTPAREGWRKRWIVVARSTLLGDPYFLDTLRPDVEGDCPVMTAMSGTESLKPILCASSFACFLRILATGMEIATGFGEDAFDDQDEAIFREAMSPKVRVIDIAAYRAGHWT